MQHFLSCVAKPMASKFKAIVVSRTFFLPTLYSRPKFPNDRSHIPSANICNQFEHLKPIASKLLPLQNVEIGLLLGYNVSYVHQPQEIVSSKIESDPYAVRNLLAGVSSDQVDAPAFQIESSLIESHVASKHQSPTKPKRQNLLPRILSRFSSRTLPT